MREFTTPMMQQYLQIKQQYSDCLLFFRLGDFYELFLDDATVGAHVLGITLTSRPRGKDGHIPMAGVPFHAADQYLHKLVQAGHKVAICEQTSDPDGKNLVERAVVRIVTPGTVLDEKSLDRKQHNFIASVTVGKQVVGLALADISTGEFLVAGLPYESDPYPVLINELALFAPRECILQPGEYDQPALLQALQTLPGLNLTCYQDWSQHAHQAEAKLKSHFHVRSLASFGLNRQPEVAQAAAALLGYLAHTQQDKVQHVTRIRSHLPGQVVGLDRSTVNNLELFQTLRSSEKRGALIEVIDTTRTAMGGRLLRSWLRAPLREQTQIEARLDAVAELVEQRGLRKQTRNLLEQLVDLDRLLSRLTVGLGNAHDLKHLEQSLELVADLKKQLAGLEAPLVQEHLAAISPTTQDLVATISTTIQDEPGTDVKNGNLIKPGVHAELDKLRSQAQSAKDWMIGFEAEERARTDITTLKCGYNSVFGYYIEVSKSHLPKVPPTYIRKQTLVNAERFITDELKQYEEQILTAEERSKQLEYELYLEVVQAVLDQLAVLQQVSQAVATLDCLLGLAELAETEHYVRPQLVTTGELKITQGRHPVVEKLLTDSQFVPNDTLLNPTDHQLIILTGPNMAGKSVYMRQVALIVLLAHLGSFVPAQVAMITLVDRIFVRSGASDMISSGLSTFMVEMVETAYILNHATQVSLVIMDEIGRGTSTYDGISIAWAVAEHLVTSPSAGAKTLFATHYHELQELESYFPEQIKNYHMAITTHEGEPVFLHSLQRGGAAHSFGVAVAKLAGVPAAVTKRAAELLPELEHRGETTAELKPPLEREAPEPHPALQHLESLSVNEMTPLEALTTLARLKDQLRNH